jgi:hypothetical protein
VFLGIDGFLFNNGIIAYCRLYRITGSATASVKLLSVYSSNVLGIQAAAFGIWLINLVIPALIGSLLIFGIKIMKER